MCRWTQVILRRNRKSCLVCFFLFLWERSVLSFFSCALAVISALQDIMRTKFESSVSCMHPDLQSINFFFVAYIHNFDKERKSSLKAVLVYFSSKQHSVLLTQCTMDVNKPHLNLSKSAACGRDLRRGVFWRLSPAYKFFFCFCFFFRLELYRNSRVCLPSAHPFPFQHWQNLIGVKGNFMFSPQLVLFVLPFPGKDDTFQLLRVKK